MFKYCLAKLSSVGQFSTCSTLQNFSSTVLSSRSHSIFSHVSSQFLTRNLYPIAGITNPPSRGVKRVIDDAAEKHRLLRFDRKHGKRTSVDIVPKQFYRLHWGAWIRTKCGRDKTVHKKSTRRMRRLRRHVFCNATQSKLLDRLTGPYFKRRHYFVDDEYEPYHSREDFLYTRKKPLPPTENIFVDSV